MITYDINADQGPLPLTFGMSPEEVKIVCGPALTSLVNDLGELEEHRECIRTRYFPDNRSLIEVTFLPGSVVRLHSSDLFTLPDTIRYLSQFDKRPYECVGFIVFLKLGIAIAGFHDNTVDQQSITVFSQGRWDDLRSEMVPYKV